MTFDEFIVRWNGKGVDTDGYYGFQCMDLAHKYAVDVVGKDIPVGNANEMWNFEIEGYDKIFNSPTAVPNKGDIVIWGTGIGINGHIAIFISGDTNSFLSFDQNWPIGSLCHSQNHNYTGVLGWFHPKQTASDTIVIEKKVFEELVTKSTKFDAFVQAGYTSPEQVKALLDASEAAKKALELQVADLKKQLAELPNQPIPPHSEFKIGKFRVWILNE